MKESGQLPIEAVTQGPKSHFIGFNDVCPWETNGKYIFALETDINGRVPNADDKATVGVVDLRDEKKVYPSVRNACLEFATRGTHAMDTGTKK